MLDRCLAFAHAYLREGDAMARYVAISASAARPATAWYRPTAILALRASAPRLSLGRLRAALPRSGASAARQPGRTPAYSLSLCYLLASTRTGRESAGRRSSTRETWPSTSAASQALVRA